jgi:hypothetical protein
MNSALRPGSPARRGLIGSAVLVALVAGSFGIALITSGAASASPTLLTWSAAAPVDPGSNNAMSVSCVSTSVCVATDMEHTIWTTTNASSVSPTWASGSIDSGGNLNAVSCVPGGALCVAIDPSGNLFESTTPAGGATTWASGGNIGGTSNAAAISCASTSLCTIVDESGNVYTSTNPAGGHTDWTGPGDINSGTWIPDVVCPSAGLCVATTINDKILTSTTPTNHSTGSWPGTPIAGNPLFPVACTQSASVCVAGDGGGYVYTSSNPAGGGSTWSTGTLLSGGSGALVSAAGCGSDSSGDICLVGDANGNVYESTNPAGGGSTFSAANPIDSGIKIWSISCPSTSFCVLGDNSGNIFYGTANGTTTPTPPTPTPSIPTSTVMQCDYFLASQNDTCTATVGNADGSITSTPTGTVNFTGDETGACPLQPTAGSPGVASCSITVPGTEVTFLNVTASYAGDTTHSASSGSTDFVTAAPGTGLYSTTIGQFNPQTLQFIQDNPVSGSTLTGEGQLTEDGTTCSPTSDTGGNTSAAAAREAKIKFPTLTVKDTVRHAHKGLVKLRLALGQKKLRRLFPGTHTITLELQVTETPPHGASQTIVEFDSFVLRAPKHGKVRVSRLQSVAGTNTGAAAAHVASTLRGVERAHEAAGGTVFSYTVGISQTVCGVPAALNGTLTLAVTFPPLPFTDPARNSGATGSLTGTLTLSACGSPPLTPPVSISVNASGTSVLPGGYNVKLGHSYTGLAGHLADASGTVLTYVVSGTEGLIWGTLGTGNSACKTIELVPTPLPMPVTGQT